MPRVRLQQDRGPACGVGVRHDTRPARCCTSSRRIRCRRRRPLRRRKTAPKPAADRAVAAKDGQEGDLVIRGQGIDDLLVYRAKCCNPIRGESIVGYVTRGKGVAVHSTNCANVQNLMYEVERKIDVEWARAPARTSRSAW